MSDRPPNTDRRPSEMENVREDGIRTFSSPAGRSTLARILRDCGFFDPMSPTDALGCAKQNLARQLLHKYLGLGVAGNQDYERFVDSILPVATALVEPGKTPEEA